MAEFVQENLEEMIPELEQLQRVELLTGDEVRQVIKRRKRFEYKIQKQKKNKEDFLSYIQYEVGLISLIAIRRKKIGYNFKKSDIEFPINNRIDKLFRLLEQRFPLDVKIWMSHIEFAKNVGWKTNVSKTFRRFIQGHTNDVQVWIAAAKYELEVCGNPDTTRKIMLEALRFHPESMDLYREYFRFEIIYVDMLRKRSTVLGIADLEVPSEKLDSVLEGCVVISVLKMATNAIPEAEFLASLLHVVSSTESPQQFHNVRNAIFDILKENHNADPVAWDTLAREALSRGSSLNECCRIYEEGLSLISKRESLENLMEFYIETLGSIASLLEGERNDLVLRAIAAKLLNALEIGHEKRILKERFYSEWVSLLHPEKDHQKISHILLQAREIFLNSASILKECLTSDLYGGAGIEDIIKTFFEGIRDMPPKDIPMELWEFMFVNVASRKSGMLEDFYRQCQNVYPDKTLRSLFFEHLYTVRGLEAARAFYDENQSVPPFDKDFHLKALDFELSAFTDEDRKKLNKKRIRGVFEVATSQFGTEDIDIWLRYLDFEKAQGKSANYAIVLNRAKNAIKSQELRDLFAIKIETC